MWWLLACNGEGIDPKQQTGDTVEPTTPVGFAAFEPAPGTLYRLTEAEWRNSAEDLFGVRYEGALPIDYLLYNYSRVGGSELTIPPLDLELYEAAAWSVATAVAPDADAAAFALGVDPDDLGAVRAQVALRLERAWRRPPTPTELDALMAQYATQLAHGPALAAQATVASILLAPDFLFRVELGEPDPAHDGWRRYSEWEMAGRLGSLLLASVPDDELMRAARAGELTTDPGLVAQVDRLLATPRGHAAMETFFAETLELAEIDAVTKDLELYPEWTATLRAQAVAETVTLFRQVALERDADLAELLTDTTAVVGPELGALYGAPVSAPDTLVQLPASRGGLLGRAAFLSIQSHNTSTSPTFRGKFVRTKLLCENVPPPPPGVSTDLEPLPNGTLRDQLMQHQTNPACAGCHTLIDPPGFALEHLDPIGRWRDLDNGLPIDATGEIDGVAFDGAGELGAVVAENPKYAGCLATEVYRFANASLERPEDLGTIDAIGVGFAADGRRFSDLMTRVVLSDAFRKATAPLGDGCATDGETRSCASPCGEGTETCVGGVWRGCTAPAESAETCNGFDDDCDGEPDDLERTCDAPFGLGTQVCAQGAWTECQGPGPTDEVCNGLDDDQDGSVDEDLQVAVWTLTPAEVTSLGHYACDVVADPWSPACHAAASRACAGSGCAVTGFGPVGQRPDEVDLVCLDATEASVVGTTFTELSVFHYDCHAGNRQGGPCNAAINRMCATLGATTGYGPVENSGDAATVVCTPAATVLESSYTALAAEDPGCNQVTRWGSTCDHAIHQWCRGLGYTSGHGPLENSGDLAIVACLGGVE
ncbi:MAG: DUF1588 domain-containing protein [Myxococcota bacterium]